MEEIRLNEMIRRYIRGNNLNIFVESKRLKFPTFLKNIFPWKHFKNSYNRAVNIDASLAQLVERLTRNEKAASSILAAG